MRGRLLRGSGKYCLGLVIALSASACKKPYRIGERVLVQHDGGAYAASIIRKKDKTSFRVHYDGCESRWDEDVPINRIKQRIDDETDDSSPVKGRCPAAPTPKTQSSATLPAPYKVGDRIKVRWRGSIYAATIVGVVADDRFLIHYDGHESAWDETIPLDRIVRKK